MGDDLLDQQAVKELLLETFGLDVNKSSFMLEKWNESWSEALSHKKSARLSPLPIPIPSSSLSLSSKAEKEKEIEEDGFREIAQKLNPLSRSLDYYIGRETTDRDTEDQFKSWKMIKRYMESRDPRVQSQRNHFGISPERELDFAQASFCPTETRICTLSLSSSSSTSSSSSSPSAERKYVMTSAGASWDILFSSSTSSSSSTPPQTKDTARRYTETFLSILDNYPSIFSFFRREIEKQNLQIETISASEIRKKRDLFNRSRHDEFFNADGFCVKDESGTFMAMATCSKSVFDPSISLNLTEDDAVDCSHLPFYGSNFSEEDKFEFASKSGLRMFVWLHPDLEKEEAKLYLASMLALIVIEANAENSFVSIALDCEKSLCPQLSQTLGFFRTFSVSAKDLRFKGFEIYDVSKAPPVQIQDQNQNQEEETQFNLFRIFPSASQVLGSALLLWLQLNEKEKDVLQGGKKMTKSREEPSLQLQGDRRPPFRPRAAEEDSLTTIENSAIRFDKSVDVWKGNINSLRDQLVEEEK
jgi:hypothetical protein